MNANTIDMVTTAGLFGAKHYLFSNSAVGDSVSIENNEEIISRLKFIGHIQKDEKINVRFVNRQPNNWITAVKRSFFWHDSRDNALKFIKLVISRSFEIIDLSIRKMDVYIARNIIADLCKAKTGLLNLRYTYIDDTKFCCDIDVLIEKISANLRDIEKNYPELLNETQNIKLKSVNEEESRNESEQ
jgi:hypothetical protein